MPNEINDGFQTNFDKALAQLEQQDYVGALATIETAKGDLIFQNLLNSSLNAPKLPLLGLSYNSLNFEQSVQFARLELLQARIHEPLQQEGTYVCAVACADRCKLLRSYAIKNGTPQQKAQVEELLNEALLFTEQLRQQKHSNPKGKVMPKKQSRLTDYLEQLKQHPHMVDRPKLKEPDIDELRSATIEKIHGNEPS